MLLLRSHDAAMSDDLHGGIISQWEILCVLGWQAERGSCNTCLWLPQLEKADEFGIRTYSDADPNQSARLTRAFGNRGLINRSF